MVRYVKCPRCELNYIDEEKQEYCDVCLAELHGNKLQFADLDEEELEELDGELEQEELCPVCGVNTLRYGEKLCESCKQKASEYETEEDIDIEKDEEWKNYLDEDDGDLTVDDDTLQEELDAELDGEEEEEESFDDDFFDEDLESLTDLEDEEDYEDEDEDDDF
ncbi:MAG: hypothetical protein HFK05_00400 [Clostridia bacterium]|nr:hypothetical protein [Clostridia bacterium]